MASASSTRGPEKLFRISSTRRLERAERPRPGPMTSELYLLSPANTLDHLVSSLGTKPVITSGIERDSYELSIYNRWGELFFTTKDYTQGWDGTFRGNPVQNGTYSYQIIYSKTGQTKKNTIVGHINLIR